MSEFSPQGLVLYSWFYGHNVSFTVHKNLQIYTYVHKENNIIMKNRNIDVTLQFFLCNAKLGWRGLAQIVSSLFLLKKKRQKIRKDIHLFLKIDGLCTTP